MTLLVKEPERQPRLVSILAAVANVSQALGIVLRITETIGNGRHGPDSLHYALRAVDIGSKEFDSNMKQRILLALRSELGDKYDVLLENEGKLSEHFHVEFDPK